MKKFFIFGAAVFAAVAVTGCRMCCDPIVNDPSCIESTHYREVSVGPESMVQFSPNFAGSRELFRPVFRAGTERITVIGEGHDREGATQDAIAKFLELAKCDFIVSVNTISRKHTHPTWRIFSTSNYSVTLSGLPVYLDKLSCETLKEEPSKPPVCDCKNDIKQLSQQISNIQIVKCECSSCKNEVSPALLKLSDINVSISAKGSTDDKAGVVFPVK